MPSVQPNRSRKIIASILAGLLAAGTLYLFLQIGGMLKTSVDCSAHPFDFLPAGCPQWFLLFLARLPKGVLSFLCVVTELFNVASLHRPTNGDGALFLFFLPFASLPFALMLVESNRASSSFLAPLWPAIIALVGQVIGFSVSFPIWLISYFLWSRPGSPVSSGRLKFGSAITYLLMINIFGMIWLPQGSLLTYFIIFFQIAPLLPYLFTIPVPKGLSLPAADLSKVYYFFGGIAATGHILGLVNFIQNPSMISEIIKLFQTLEQYRHTVLIADALLWLDFASVILAILLLVWYISGWKNLLWFTLFSVVFSPGLLLSILLVQHETGKHPHRD